MGDLLVVILIACILDVFDVVHYGKFSSLVVGCVVGYLIFRVALFVLNKTMVVVLNILQRWP